MTDATIAPPAPAPQGRFLSMKDVVEDSSLSQATINRLHRRGQFPRKRKLSANRVGWWESDYLAWKADRDRAPDHH